MALPTAAVAVPAHGEGAAAVLNEQAEGGASLGAVCRRQGIPNPCHQLRKERDESTFYSQRRKKMEMTSSKEPQRDAFIFSGDGAI